MKKYNVYRKLIVNDSCVVRAKNKTEAIAKAKACNFDDDDLDWEMGNVNKVLKKYEAEEQK